MYRRRPGLRPRRHLRQQCGRHPGSGPHQPGGWTGCTPPPAGLKKLTITKDLLPKPPEPFTGSACGALIDETVPLNIRKSKTKAGVLHIHIKAKANGVKPASDKDTFTLRCLPRTTPCPTTTTTVPTTSTTI